MKILYKPFGIIAGLLGAKISNSIFKAVWIRIDDEDPPKPTTAGASFPKIVGGAALEAATMAAVGAVVDRASVRLFHHLTGIWPGERRQLEPPEPEPQEQ